MMVQFAKKRRKPPLLKYSNFYVDGLAEKAQRGGVNNDNPVARKNQMTIEEIANSLTTEQMLRLYEFIDGPLDADIAALTDDELLSELTA